MSRATERRDMDIPTRLILVDRDLDEHEIDIEVLSNRLDKILWALVGILISTSTAAILLALNMAVK